MSDRRPPYDRRPTRPLPRAVLPPPASSTALEQDAVVTLVPCPACSGIGMMTAERRARLLEEFPELADHASDSKSKESP